MKTADFDYALPAGRIAERPAEPRDAARLLVVRRATGALEDRVVRDLPDLLDLGDLLVVNDTKVIPARLNGAREGTGGRVEVFLLREEGGRRWRVLLDPARRFAPGVRIAFDGAACEVVEVYESGDRAVAFDGDESVLSIARRIGATPLPPYIRRDADARDRDDYQTVFARAEGAVAAPTAGLHFTPALLGRLAARGVVSAPVTLHVGPGTFRPVTVEDAAAHRMDAEAYEVSSATSEAVNAAHVAGRRVVAVGTTSVRTLETAATGRGRVAAGGGLTEAFIYPPYEFRAVTAMLTNFHLPKSTLLMLVSAFGGRELVLSAYAHAVREGYRFYSYGDAMLLL